MTRIWNKHKQSNTPLKRKVFVGLSGGVDSSVAAYLLKKQGFDVVGVFIKVWHPDWLPCTWREERRSAMRVSAVLGIPLVTLDLEKEYKQGVVDYLIREYASGATPNPDVMCNREVKFGAFYTWARSKGAVYVATGHYARKCEKGLCTAKDQNKDQTYFLWTLSKEVLAHTLFPLGEYEKNDVRKLAHKAGLPTAEKKDSQGICFLGEVNMKEFLEHYIDIQPGVVLNISGEPIGTHNGALLYTIGQRHGFTIHKKGTDSPAQYVVSKNVEDNTITVSPSFERAQSDVVTLKEINWNTDEAPKSNQLMCRVRYRQRLMPCEIVDESSVRLIGAHEPATPGQSLVIYDGERCLGGGVIV
ncbi:MAG: tRNA 2-thiouridine(34) synthase MnmA [bacterium]|nr:tRNA 2-thiouridine(34) synthase MnmA [bacterium]